MIKIGNNTFVAGQDIKEVILEGSLLKIHYKVTQNCEKTIHFGDKDHAETFKQYLLAEIKKELGQNNYIEARKEFALEFLLRLEEHYFIEEK